jgi:pimeloyl-ACP methyl ester carboxylesterase
MKKFFTITYSTIQLFLLVFPLGVRAQTISTNTVLEKGVHNISEDLIIEEGSKLTILPGAHLVFNDGKVMQVLGDLVVGSSGSNGAGSMEKVVFEGSQAPNDSIGDAEDGVADIIAAEGFTPTWSISVSGSAVFNGVEIRNSTQGLESFGGTVEMKDVSMQNLGWCFSFDQETHFKLVDLECKSQTMGSGISGQSEGSLKSVSFIDMKNSGEVLGLYNSNINIEDVSIKVRGRQKGIVFNRGEYSLLDSRVYFSDGTVVGAESSAGVPGVLSDLNNQTRGIAAYKNTLVLVASTTFRDLGYGIHNFGGEIRVASSTLENNDISVFQTPLAQVGIDYGIGGNTSGSSGLSDLVTLSGSRVLNNIFDIKNDMLEPINAQGVWWGGSAPKIEGVVDVKNPLADDPWSLQTQTACCASIVLIPGFQASQLGLMSNDDIKDVLWAPHNNGDVRSLFFNSAGESNYGIRAFEILNSVFGKEYYAPITHHLNSLVDRGVIASWSDFPYDWRYSIFNIQASSTESGDKGLEKLRQLVLEESLRSKNGKVTLIAHSNGGLVTRALIAQYPDISAKIESIIYVGVPHIGTPKAIASLLHGAGESILAGILMRAKTARDFGLTLPGAFGLLPHSSFFGEALKPVITFSTSTQKLLGINQGSINQIKSLDSFLTKIRTGVKDATQLSVPSTLSGTLLGAARGEQNRIVINEQKVFKEYSIYGTGIPTIETLAYKSKDDSCKVTRLNKCNLENLLLPTYQMSKNGDGTVLSLSASVVGIPFEVDLLKESQQQDDEKIEHATLFKSQKVKDIITQIIEQSDGEQILALAQESVDQKMSTKENDDESSGADVQQIISIHSPVALHVYDSYGNHTGPQIRTDLDTLPEDFLFIDEEIPGSSYIDQGHEASIYLSTVEPISIELIGTDVGKFSLDITTQIGDKVIDIKNYTDIPVIVGSQVQLDLDQKILETSTTTAVTFIQLPQLKVDIDADGNVDSVISHDQKIPHQEKKRLKLEMLKFILSKYFDARFNKIYIDQLQQFIKKLSEIKKEKTDEQTHKINYKNEAVVFKSLKVNKKQMIKVGEKSQHIQQDQQKIKKFIDIEFEQLLKSE